MVRVQIVTGSPQMVESAQTSMGHNMSSTSWLDTHFETAREEYEGALKSVGILPGWRVLDAGCGSGNYLPLIAELVGPDGAVDAVDLAPENVAKAEASLPSPAETTITVRVASILALPFEADTFDCIWCANVVQYLTPADFQCMAKEFERVLRPGGVVALKDADATHLQMYPFDADILARYLAAVRQKHANAGVLGSACGTVLATRLRQVGFEELQRRGWLIERWAPVAPFARAFVGQLLTHCASSAADLDLPEADKRYWNEMAASPGELLDDADFCLREVHVVVTGRNPIRRGGR